jgi:hypothetical protein
MTNKKTNKLWWQNKSRLNGWYQSMEITALHMKFRLNYLILKEESMDNGLLMQIKTFTLTVTREKPTKKVSMRLKDNLSENFSFWTQMTIKDNLVLKEGNSGSTPIKSTLSMVMFKKQMVTSWVSLDSAKLVKQESLWELILKTNLTLKPLLILVQKQSCASWLKMSSDKEELTGTKWANGIEAKVWSLSWAYLWLLHRLILWLIIQRCYQIERTQRES